MRATASCNKQVDPDRDADLLSFFLLEPRPKVILKLYSFQRFSPLTPKFVAIADQKKFEEEAEFQRRLAELKDHRSAGCGGCFLCASCDRPIYLDEGYDECCEYCWHEVRPPSIRAGHWTAVVQDWLKLVDAVGGPRNRVARKVVQRVRMKLHT